MKKTILVILLLSIAILSSTLFTGCSIKCPEPTIIDYSNNVCCDDLNNNHICDNSEEKPLKFPGIEQPITKDTNETKLEGDTMASDDEKIEDSNTIVEINTNKGIIKVMLEDEKAPITTQNFISLVNDKFYEGLTFHRYVPGFVIQGGDPKGDGTGGSDRKIKLETHPDLVHDEGVIAMARANDPNSASSQFYITLAPTHQLDGEYAVFGKVIEGMDVVKELRQGDKMESVSVVEN